MIGDGGRFRAYKKLSIPVYPVPKSAQQTIPVYAISANGDFQIEPNPDGTGKTACFDRCYRFSDVNYASMDDHEQAAFAKLYYRMMNYLSSSFKILVINRTVNPDEFEAEVLYGNKDGYEDLAAEFNALNIRRLREARSLRQEKYLVITCNATDFESAAVLFDNMESSLRNHFMAFGSSITRLSLIERLRLLHDFYNVGKETEFNLTEEALASGRNWKDDVICTYMKEKRDMIEMEDHYVTTLFAKLYPPQMDDDILKLLSSKRLHMIISMDIAPVPNGVARKMLEDCLSRINMSAYRQQDYRRKHNDFSTEITYEVQRKREEIIADLDEMNNNNAQMFYVGLTITLSAGTKEELDLAVKDLIACAGERALYLKPYTGRQLAAMNTSLPLGYRGVKIMRDLFTQSAAALMPFHAQEMNDTGGIVYGINQTTKQLIRGNRKALPNGNGFIFGSTGYGKSVNAKMEICQVLLATDDDVVIVDPQNEYFDICRRWEGQVINLSEKSTDHINPMDIPDLIENQNDFIMDRSDFMRGICTMALAPMPLTLKHHGIIDRCIRIIYERIFNHQGNGIPTFLTFRDELKKQPEEEAQEMADALEIFVEGSLSLFSHQSNVDMDNRFIVYGINDLGVGLRPMALLIMIESVRNRIASNARIGRATWVYVDECHSLLNDSYGQLAFEKLWKEVRKQGGLMTGITQNLLDCLVSKRTRSLISNSEYISMLSQSEFEKDTFEDVLEMSKTQMEKITKAAPGTGIMKFGERMLAFDNTIPKESELYRMFNTNLHEKAAMGMFRDEK